MGTPGCVNKKLEEKEFVVDSGANMHMVSKNDLNSAELENKRISRNPTTVMTANGEVQTRDEATVYVNELDLFVTVMLLEETPAVLSLGKLCEDHEYTYRWTSGQKNHISPKMATELFAINVNINMFIFIYGGARGEGQAPWRGSGPRVPGAPLEDPGHHAQQNFPGRPGKKAQPPVVGGTQRGT